MKRYEDLEPHHKRMVDDGCPIEIILTEEERAAARARASLTQVAREEGPKVPNLSMLSQASQERVLKLIQARKFRPHWLEDLSIVEHIEAKTRELQRKREETIERLKSLPQKEKPSPKPDFGTGVKIKVLKEVSFRKEGTKGAAIYAEMVAWVKKNPDGDLAALISSTRYHRGFYLADLERGNIKSDVK